MEYTKKKTYFTIPWLPRARQQLMARVVFSAGNIVGRAPRLTRTPLPRQCHGHSGMMARRGQWQINGIATERSSFGGRQQRVRRPSDKVYGGRQTRCRRPSHNGFALLCRKHHATVCRNDRTKHDGFQRKRLQQWRKRYKAGRGLLAICDKNPYP